MYPHYQLISFPLLLLEKDENIESIKNNRDLPETRPNGQAKHSRNSYLEMGLISILWEMKKR